MDGCWILSDAFLHLSIAPCDFSLLACGCDGLRKLIFECWTSPEYLDKFHLFQYVILLLFFKNLLKFLFYFIFILFYFTLLFCFWPHRVACGILVPSPGIEPGPPAVETWSPNHWTAREFPVILLIHCWIWWLIFCWGFCICVHEKYWSVGFISCNICDWFWYYGTISLIE